MCMLMPNVSYAAFLVCHFVVVLLLVFFLKITALKKKTMVSCLKKRVPGKQIICRSSQGKQNNNKKNNPKTKTKPTNQNRTTIKNYFNFLKSFKGLKNTTSKYFAPPLFLLPLRGPLNPQLAPLSWKNPHT